MCRSACSNLGAVNKRPKTVPVQGCCEKLVREDPKGQALRGRTTGTNLSPHSAHLLSCVHDPPFRVQDNLRASRSSFRISENLVPETRDPGFEKDLGWGGWGGGREWGKLSSTRPSHSHNFAADPFSLSRLSPSAFLAPPTFHFIAAQVGRKYLPPFGNHVFKGIPTDDGVQELLFSLPRCGRWPCLFRDPLRQT